MRTMLLSLGLAALIATAGTANAGATPAQKCAGSIRKCCGVLFLGIVKCHAAGAVKTVDDSTDPACVDKAKGKYDLCTAKALGKGGCISDQVVIDHLKDEIENAWAADVKGDVVTQ